MNHHISKEAAQQIVETVKSVCGYNVNFIDPGGNILASTDPERIGSYHSIGRQTAMRGTTLEVWESQQHPGSRPGINVPVFYNQACIAVIGISGQPDKVRPYAELARRVTELLIREQEINTSISLQMEQRSYLLNALLQNNSKDPAQLEELLHQLHVDSGKQKRIVLVRFDSSLTEKKTAYLEERVLDCFRRVDVRLYMRQYPNDLVGMLEEEKTPNAQFVLKGIACEEQGRVQIAVGRAVALEELSVSDDSARVALRVGTESGNAFVMFDDLSLELIFASLSSRNKSEFLNKTINGLNESDLELLRVYFSCNMSLTETAKTLFIHKNTVQYQLNRIAKITNLNPRTFQDAVLLYLAITLLSPPFR